jgi:two-component system NarL family sensor kinase
LSHAAAKGIPGRPQSAWAGAYGNTPVDERINAASVALLELQQRLLERLQRLQTAEQRLSTLRRNREPSGARLIRQLERERQRLGRELHTEVGQMLAAIHIQFEILEPHLPEMPEAAREALQKISTLAQEALEQVRNISRRLHPPEWQRLKLEDAIRQLWDLSGADRRFETRVSIQSLPADPSVEIKSLIFRAAQEGITNVMRHAQAKRVDLTLVFLRDILSLQLRDDGVGFDVAQVLAAPANVASGIGLRSIREQAAELRGKVSITSGPLGTTLEISVPWRPRSA